MKPHTFDRSRYSTDLLARVAEGWRHLAQVERQGVISAAEVTADLTAHGAPAPLLAMAARVVQDEVRHVEVCAGVVDAIGTGGRTHLPIEIALDRPPTGKSIPVVGVVDPEAGRAVVDEHDLARRLVTEWALVKPVSAAAYAEARAWVREPLFAWAYAELLHDETRHATFGAKAAAWVVRHWSAAQRRALWTECLASGAPSINARPRDHEAESLGLLPGDGDCALPSWIMQHLTPLGLQLRPANAQSLIH
jgi:hypothetical protein